MDQPSNPTNTDLKLVTLALLTGMILFHLGFAFFGPGIGRDQHLGTAVEYAKGDINLLRPILIGANANDVPTPMEFPIWQALTAILMKLFGTWYGWGNFVSLAFHISTLWPVFALGNRLHSARTGWWAVLFYAAQPMAFIWGGMASADGAAASFAIWFVYLGWRMMTSAHWGWWLAATVVGALSATTKAPFFMVGGLAVFFWLLREHRRSRPAWLKLTSVGAISIICFLAWNRYAHSCYHAAELSWFDFRMGKGSQAAQWWFGDWSSRFSIKTWLRGAKRAPIALFGNAALLLLPLAGWFVRGNIPLRLWTLAGAATTVVFTTLILGHWHYYYIFSAPAVLLAASAAVTLEPALWGIVRWKTPLRSILVLFVVAATLAQGLQGMNLSLYMDRYPSNCARTIQENTSPADKLLVWNGGWTTPLLRAQRRGLTISWSAVQDTAKLQRLKELGFNKLVLMNDSPLLLAVNKASGFGDYVSRNLLDELPAVARDWKVTYSSPSVLILEIPR